MAAWGNTVYYVGTNNGENHSSARWILLGNTTVLGTSLSFGGAGAERLMFAPNGTLYAFDADYGGGSGAWGSVNLANGAFNQIGNLNTYFPSYEDHNENYGFSLAFGPSGNLYATGWGTDDNFDYGTLSLTTGVFTKIATSPVEIRRFVGRARPRTVNICLVGRRCFFPACLRMAAARPRREWRIRGVGNHFKVTK